MEVLPMKEGEEEGGKDYFGRENDNDKQDKSEGEQLVTRQVKKRKVALFLAYNGRDYQGMQRNPGAKTIEEILEKALVDAGGVSDSNAGTFVKIGWSRSARTDKGVSALCQVVSLKLLMHNEDVDNVMRTEQSEKGETVENDKANTNLSKEDKKNISIVGKINSILPDDIRILGLKRVAGGFCARNECDRRVYEYVIPTFVLDPVLCREKQYYIKNKLIDPHNHDSAAEVNKEFTEAKLTKFDESQRARLNLILSNFIGTHAFHNFTVGMVPGDPKANRYILEFSADKEVFTIGGIEFLTIRVKGQSFILHQIRKMIGMTLAVMRGVATTDQLQKAFRKDIVMGIPMAPEVGLFLVSCLFDCYNKKFYERMKSHDRLDSDDFLVAQNRFKETFIYQHIAQMENEDRTMEMWCRNNLNSNRFSFEGSAVKQSVQGKKRKIEQDTVPIGKVRIQNENEGCLVSHQDEVFTGKVKEEVEQNKVSPVESDILENV